MQHKNIIVFDGVCNFCSRGVHFVIKRDYQNLFMFAAMQSKAGALLLKNNGISPDKAETFLLLKDGRAYTKSDAALAIASEFRRGWKLLLIFRLVPKIIRDFVYQIIAKNRYAWFGKKTQCMVPGPEIRSRFIE